MKFNSKSIEMIAWFDYKGIVHPLRFKVIKDNNEEIVLNIISIKNRYRENLGGNPMDVFICDSHINNKVLEIKIKYEIMTNKWIVFTK
ncbi:MAG: hypothetical protein GX752_06465 [Clostridium sp.]|nr:hypothetical protein [Clostridium sp.]